MLTGMYLNPTLQRTQASGAAGLWSMYTFYLPYSSIPAGMTSASFGGVGILAQGVAWVTEPDGAWIEVSRSYSGSYIDWYTVTRSSCSE